MSYFGEGFHGMELLEPRGDEPLFDQIKYLIYNCIAFDKY
jgi:hypothetical protein